MTRRLFLLCTFLATTPLALAATHPNVASGYDVGKAYEMSGIDNVSLFNGNLNLVIPIGQTYHLDGGLAYSFRLTYGGNPWIHAARFDTSHVPAFRYWHTVPKVNRTSFATGLYPPHNAGMGWQLSLGYIENMGGIWTYYSPDGAEHTFRSKLHLASNEVDNPNFFYSGDATYLRLHKIVINENGADVEYQDLEFPDGTVHRFHAASGVLTEMRDRFDNKVTIAYAPSRDAATTWTITEQPKNGTSARTHYVYLKTIAFPGAQTDSSGGDQPQYLVVTQVDLAAFGGTRAVYNFHYGPGPASSADSLSVISRRQVNQWDALYGPTTQAPLLTNVSLPDGSSWSMLKPDGTTPDYDVGDGVSTSHMTEPGPTFSGQITGLVLPTKGRYAWTYQRYEFPTDAFTGKYADGAGALLDRSAGVKDAYRRNRDQNGQLGSVVEHTSYVQKLVRIATQQHPAAPRVSITQVQRRLPNANDVLFSTSVHFFSVATDPTMDEYALPFTREAIPDPDLDGTATVYTRTDGITNPGQITGTDCATSCPSGRDLFLSSKVHDAAGSLLRYTFLRYEGGATGTTPGDDLNSRVASERTVYHDDNDTHATVDRADFDGFGHYRIEKTSGNFDAGNVRTTTTAWNQSKTAVGSTGHNAGTLPGSWAPWPIGSNWVLNTYTGQSISEGQQTSTTLACFDAATGFLKRTRVLKNSTPGQEDLVKINFDASGAGNVEYEQFFGGDNAGLDTSTALCDKNFGQPPYQLHHTYAGGVRATSSYLNNGVAMSFLALDNDVDASTGLISATRDTAGKTSTFTFDTSGRLHSFHPPGASFDATYTFSPATQNTQAKVEISQMSSTSGSLQSRTTYDDFGRVQKEEQLMPSGNWSSRLIEYDALGNKAKTSELENGIPSHFTIFGGYDAFGRASTIQTPDLKVTTLMYTGVRLTTRQVLVGTTLAPTTETYDRQGRLVKVKDANDTTTEYTYDVGGRLHTANIGTQPARVFDYDLRGFLHEETHPENGTVTYQNYDARGHAREKQLSVQSKFDQQFTYDAAERLKSVSARSPDSLSSFRLIKEFTYGIAGTQNGKLETAVRHNYLPSATDMTVTDTYTYAGPAGQVSQRVTNIAQNGVLIRSVSQSFAYDDLGALVDTIYPTCPNCENGTWDAVKQTYVNGRPTALAGERRVGGTVTSTYPFAFVITYWPNGMLNALVHGNNVTDTIGADTRDGTIGTATGMTRPGSIAYSGWSSCISVDIQSDSGDQTVTSGGTATVTVFPTAGASNPIFYQWYNGSSKIDGATGQTYPAGPLTATTTFTAVVSNACGRRTSRTITITVCSKPSDVQISPGNTTLPSPQSLNLTASATGSGVTFQWFQGATQIGTGSAFTTPVLSTTTTYFVRATNTCGFTDSAPVTYTVPLPTPPSFSATRSGTSAVAVSWTASAGAHHYELQRRSAGQPYTLVANVTTSPFTDTLSIAPNTTYVYRLRAVDSTGGSASAYTNPDLATTDTFNGVAAGATITFLDLNNLLAELNMVRAASGAGAITWAAVAPSVPPPAVGDLVRGAHIVGLRASLDNALAPLGITSNAYTDSSLSSIPVRAIHIEELRGRMQ